VTEATAAKRSLRVQPSRIDMKPPLDLSEKAVRLAQNMQVGPCIPAGKQLERAEVGPTSGPTWRLPHSGFGRASPLFRIHFFSTQGHHALRGDNHGHPKLPTRVVDAGHAADTEVESPGATQHKPPHLNAATLRGKHSCRICLHKHRYCCLLGSEDVRTSPAPDIPSE
jgi:hypothetical protein